MRILGVDLGRRRVGLAVADGDARIATPWRTLRVGGREDAIREIVAVIRDEGFDRAVVGVPFDADGREGPEARRARRIAGVIARRSGVPVALADEYATSREAAALRREAGVGGPDDASAAAILLQSRLDQEGRAP